MEKKLHKIYPTDYNLLKAQYLWQNSFSNHVNNLSEGIHKIKCKYRHDAKKCKIWRNEYSDCFLECTNFKDLIEYKCLCCNENYKKKSLMKTYF